MATNKTKKKASTEPKQTWNKITGRMKIWGNKFDKFVKYSVSFAGKDDDGDYQNFYLDVAFTKDCDAPVSAGLYWIDIQNAFLSTRSWEDKKGNLQVRPILIVTECEILQEPDEGNKKGKSSKTSKTSKKKHVEEDDEDEDDEDEDDEDEDLPF